MAVVGAVAAAFRMAHRLGYTDEDLAQLVSRPGRVLGVWTVRAWREPHRANMISATDLVRLAAVLDERAARPLVECLTRAAGMVAVDLPEVGAGRRAIEAGALLVGAECGRLQAAAVEAGADGEITDDERLGLREHADGVVREAVHLAQSVGAGDDRR